VAFTEAQQAVVDELAAQPGPVTWCSPPSPGGWVASTRAGGWADADPATVRFRKSRSFPSCELHSVTFTTRRGAQMRALARAWRKHDGSWAASPVGGGSGPGPRRPRPWVNFSAQWSSEMFTAGGEVIGTGCELARLVRLRFADGTALDDSVDDAIVLFFSTPGVAFPATVEVLGAGGDVLASYPDFDYLD
jgi:hypothetical protein